MSKLSINEQTIALYMQKNKCSREDAIELIQYDMDIDDDKPTEYDLTAEQKDVVKALMRNVEHKSGNRKPRERKPNELKESIVAEIAEFLREDAQSQAFDNVKISNVSRQIVFNIGDRKFEINLIEKRPPKS